MEVGKLVKMNLYLQVSKQMTRKDLNSLELDRKSELNVALRMSQTHFSLH